MKPIIGAHVSASGGVWKAVERGTAIGAEAIQIFVSGPQSYGFKQIPNEDIDKFNMLFRESGLKALFFHAIYLINLASPDKQKHHLAKQSLVDYLTTNAKMHGDGVVTHIGTQTGCDSYEQAIENIQFGVNWVLEKTPPESTLILEVTAGSGNTIGSKYEHLRDIRAGVKDLDRVKTCWDTQHTFASGYDIKNDLEGVLKKYDELVGIGSLKVIHCNDSKTSFDSHKDRHENIGMGEIGEEVFKKLLHNEHLSKLPFMLEVPGMDGESGPDKENIEIMKRLRA